MEDVRVALAQINCVVGDLERNIEKHRQAAHHASEQGARIILYPETSLTGYPNETTRMQELALPLDSKVCQGLVDLSAETNLVLLVGLVERDISGVVYNTQLVVGPNGLQGGYRKTHVSNTEIHRFYHGDDYPVFNAAGVTFGIQICYDNHFPEGSRILALRGAEVIFCAYGSPGPATEEGMTAKRSRWLRYLTARAFDNSVYVVVVNQVGPSTMARAGEPAHAPEPSSTPRNCHVGLTEFPGGSMVLNPWGEVIAETKAPAEEVLVVDLPASVLREKRGDVLQFFTHFRRPELYGDIVRPSRVSIAR